ncbi:MAG: hypothetical protein IT555_04680 [Acetobacteraceae bacterium]|nr:hypothetical protein [Acetobacteraceae bacterium]
MVLFATLFALNVAAALVALTFFVIGLADGSVTSFNILIWAALLGVVFTMPWAGWAVRMRGRKRLGMLLLLPVAVPAIAAGVMLVLLLVMRPDWR